MLDDTDSDSIFAGLPLNEQHRRHEKHLLDIAKIMLRNGKHLGALLALAKAGCHFAEYCYLENLAAARAEGDFEYEPVRPCVGEYVQDLGETLYWVIAQEQAAD